MLAAWQKRKPGQHLQFGFQQRYSPQYLQAHSYLTSGKIGEMKLMMGIAADGKLLGVRVLAHKETPGLGDKIEAKKGPWIERFTGLSLGNPPLERWKVKKDGGDFDQFAGATITPRGVMKAIRGGLEFFADNKTALTKGD